MRLPAFASKGMDWIRLLAACSHCLHPSCWLHAALYVDVLVRATQFLKQDLLSARVGERCIIVLPRRSMDEYLAALLLAPCICWSAS